MLAPRPILPIGGERALIRLESGEFVCVDLRSLDSLMPELEGIALRLDVAPRES